jgi:hypothetical protein
MPRPGKAITIKVTRQLPAKRLGRITGGGLFAESQKLGEHLDWEEQRILGCDSVQNAVHNGRMFWAWGDTLLPDNPLGKFHMTCATTHLGNRHLPTEILPECLRIRYDHVIEDMLSKLGARLARRSAPFQPEGGAYGGHHDHGDHHHD